MASLQAFLEMNAKEEFIDSIPPKRNNNESDPDNESEHEMTFGDKMGLNQMDIWKTIRSDKRFDKSLENRYYDSISPTSHHNASSSSTNNSLSQRIQSYKFKKSKLQKAGGCPLETKIHKTPLSKKSKHFKISEQAKENEFESRDPRFDANIERNPNESGWKLRNAYKFLDEYIERDVQLIKTEIKKHKKAIKFTKKNA